MEQQIIFDFIGYLASAITLVSMLMSNVAKLRIINSIGCVVFVIYAFMISAYPIAVFNAVIIVINIVHILRLNKQTNPLQNK